MKRISLSGMWGFQPVPPPADGATGQEEFLHPPRSFDDMMMVPGSWRIDPKYRDYHGRAWYGQTFSLDALRARKCAQLTVGGVFRYATVFVNGTKAGFHAGFQSAFSVDVTGLLLEGENKIWILADDRQDRTFDIMGGCSVFETSEVLLAGIYEPVALEFKEAVFIRDLYAPYSRADNAINLSLVVENRTEKTAQVDIFVRIVDATGVPILCVEKSLIVENAQEPLAFQLPAKEFALWSPEHPTLYDIEATLVCGGVSEVLTQRTGFKQLEADGTDFVLNGHPYYLLGYGDDFVFPTTCLPDAVNKDYYMPLLRRTKEYGFNTARHHSHFPFEAYLCAADEAGLLVQPELAIANIPIAAFNDQNKKLFLSEWEALILRNRHHPCIMAWCGGNEMEWGVPFEDELYEIAKRLDPYRLATATDGNFMACDVTSNQDYSGICPAEYTDYLPYGELSEMFTRDCSGKPQIVHEMGNYTTMPTIDDLPKFKDALLRPTMLDDYAAHVTKSGKEALYRKMYPNSLTLQKRCHKLNIEKARLSPYFCGYHVWTLIDYHNTTQGILNGFYEDKAFSAEEFSRFNRQSVLLWDADNVVFEAGKKASLRVMLSAFGEEELTGARLILSLSDGQKIEIRRDFTGHGLMEAAVWEPELTADSRARKLTFSARLLFDGGEIANDWPLWIYPEAEIGGDKEIFIHYLSRHLFEGSERPVRHFTIPMPLDEKNLIVTSVFYEGMLKAVANGASMLYLARDDAFHAMQKRNSFKTPWWQQKNIWYVNHSNNQQVCGMLEDHPGIQAIPHDACWDFNMFELVEQRHAVRIDELGFEVDPIVYGLDNELNRLSYLFEFAYGKGKILVSTLNFEREAMKFSAVQFTARSIINYCMTDAFAPKISVSPEALLASLR